MAPCRIPLQNSSAGILKKMQSRFPERLPSQLSPQLPVQYSQPSTSSGSASEMFS